VAARILPAALKRAVGTGCLPKNLSTGVKGGAGVVCGTSEYAVDLSPTEGRAVRDYLTRLRAIMLDYLSEAGIPQEVRQTPEHPS
jgi:hypothetical protein